MRIEWEPALLEDAVLRAVAARPEGRLFYREREAIYLVGDVEERTRAFEGLAAAWFTRLELGRPVMVAVGEQPRVASDVGRCGVGRPPRPGDAGAELLVRPAEAGERPEEARTLRLLLPTALLLGIARLEPFLRRELQHIADMLDPAFGYEPSLAIVGGPGRQRLVRDRYRALWDASVDGRLVRRGWLAPAAKEERRRDFARTFRWLGVGVDPAFERFFGDDTPSHHALLEFAAVPGASGPGATACPLCGCMTATLAQGHEHFPPPVAALVHADFPAWDMGDGACAQCAELYRTRPLSIASAEALPGIGRSVHG